MTQTAKSPAGLGRGITSVVARHTALALDVCTEAKLAAIHVQTASGVIVIIAELAEFVSKFRGRADHNGKLLPNPGQLLTTEQQLAADAAIVPPRVQPVPEPATTAAAPTPARRARGTATPLYEQAWEAWCADPSKTLKEVGAPLGLSPNTITTYFTRKHAEEYRRLKMPRRGRTVSVVESTPASDDIPEAARALGQLPPATEHEAREAALRTAWELYIATPELNYWQLGQVLGVSASWLRRRFDRFAEEPGAPLLKPNGKLR